jgi:hypothetical protein
MSLGSSGAASKANHVSGFTARPISLRNVFAAVGATATRVSGWKAGEFTNAGTGDVGIVGGSEGAGGGGIGGAGGSAGIEGGNSGVEGSVAGGNSGAGRQRLMPSISSTPNSHGLSGNSGTHVASPPGFQ